MGIERKERAFPVDDSITFTPTDSMISQTYECAGLIVESLVSRNTAPFSYHASPSRPLFVFLERSARTDGETRIDGLPASARRNLSGTVIVVPAGHRLEDWSVPRIRTEVTRFLVDADLVIAFSETLLLSEKIDAHLFIDSSSIDGTAHKLKGLSQSDDPGDTMYAGSLSVVLQHELLRLAAGKQTAAPLKGRLAPWQERRVREHIEEHLRAGIPVAALAQIVGLSQSHFAHAFRISFGQAPHQFFNARRIEAAKLLLHSNDLTVTEIAHDLGYNSVSAFTSSFRRSTGVTPSRFRHG
jgi:AraC family transcriptional regulator